MPSDLSLLMGLTDEVREARVPGLAPWGAPSLFGSKFSAESLAEIIGALDHAEFRPVKMVKFDEATATRSLVEVDPALAGLFSSHNFWGERASTAVKLVDNWCRSFIQAKIDHDVTLDRAFARLVPVGGYAAPLHADNANVYPIHDGEKMVMRVDRTYDGEDYSAVLWLGEAAGGEVEFPQHGLDFHPRHGTLCVFPSGADYLHSGASVSGTASAGKRYIVEFRYRLVEAA